MVEHVVDLSGLAQHYRQRKEGQERLENLDELVNAAASFVADDEGAIRRRRRPCGPFSPRLLEAGEHQAGEGQEPVQLMSVHAAKGLEFDVVFITGLGARACSPTKTPSPMAATAWRRSAA